MIGSFGCCRPGWAARIGKSTHRAGLGHFFDYGRDPGRAAILGGHGAADGIGGTAGRGELSASTGRLVEDAAVLAEPEMVRIKGADDPLSDAAA
jgi:hypothetical protein